MQNKKVELVLKTKKNIVKITRSKDRNSGIIRIDNEACTILEDVLNNLKGNYSVFQLASLLIKTAMDDHIIVEDQDGVDTESMEDIEP